MTSCYLTYLLAFHSPRSPTEKRPRPGCEEGSMSQEDHLGGHSFARKQHLVHLLNPLQSPTCRAIRFLPDWEEKPQPKNAISSGGRAWKEKGRTVQYVTVPKDVITSYPMETPTLSCCVLVVFDQSGQSKVSNLAYESIPH